MCMSFQLWPITQALGKGLVEGLFAAVNLSHLYRSAPREPISMREVHMTNTAGRTYIIERGSGWLQPMSMIEVEAAMESCDFPARGCVSGLTTKLQHKKEFGGLGNLRYARKSEKMRLCRVLPFCVCASARLDMEEVSGSNPL